MKFYKKILAAAMACAIVCSLGGCRYSDTIEQMIYTAAHEGLIDYNPPFEISENSEENEELSEQLQALVDREDIERMIDEEEVGVASEEGETDTAEGSSVAYSREASAETVSDTAGEKGDSDDTKEKNVKGVQSGGIGEEQQENPLPDEQTEEEPEEAQEPPADSSPDSTEEEGKNNETGEGGETPEPDKEEESNKQVVDENGPEAEIPEGTTIAAVGEAAVMLEVLGAGDTLVATDEVTHAKAESNAAFADLAAASVLWAGDGESGIGEENFAQLLAAKPEVIVEISGSAAFTDEQIGALTADGETQYLALPELSSSENIKTAMTALSGIVGDRSGEGKENSVAVAEQYCGWVDQTISNMQAATAGTSYYAIFVDGWDAGAVFTVAKSGAAVYSDAGCAYVRNWKCGSTMNVSEFLSYANILNTTNAIGSSYYAANPEIFYLSPLVDSPYSSFSVAGTAASSMALKAWNLLNPLQHSTQWDYRVNRSGAVSNSAGRLGDTTFPYVIAADAETAAALGASKSAENGQWRNYGWQETSDAAWVFCGFFVGDGTALNNSIMSSLKSEGDYTVITNPSGYESWTSGSCESVLESVWAAWKMGMAISKADAYSYVRDFYAQFYRVDLSDAEIGAILGG